MRSSLRASWHGKRDPDQRSFSNLDTGFHRYDLKQNECLLKLGGH
jgi:hypothetical protein